MVCLIVGLQNISIKISIEANNSELAEKLWNFSSDLCSSFDFVSFDI